MKENKTNIGIVNHRSMSYFNIAFSRSTLCAKSSFQING